MTTSTVSVSQIYPQQALTMEKFYESNIVLLNICKDFDCLTYKSHIVCNCLFMDPTWFSSFWLVAVYQIALLMELFLSLILSILTDSRVQFCVPYFLLQINDLHVIMSNNTDSYASFFHNFTHASSTWSLDITCQNHTDSMNRGIESIFQ